jgi:hypothetical protein
MIEQLAVAPWRHTYDGIPVIELGDDGEWIFTPGHIDKDAFAAACEAFYQDVCGEPLPDPDPAASITHITARIIPEADFPYGEFEVRFHDGDLQVTVWTKP